VWQARRTLRLSQETVVTNLHEAVWQHMKEKAPHELGDLECHHPTTMLVPVILPWEADMVVGCLEQTMIADGDPVRVASQVLEHGFGTAERWLRVYDPLERTSTVEQTPKCLCTAQVGEPAVTLECACLICLLQECEEFSAIQPAEYADRKKESRSAAYPAGCVGSNSARWHDAVDVGMMQKVLSPRMQNGQEADAGSEMPRCSCNLQQRLTHRTEEQAINHLWILQRERRKQIGQREYHMRVWHG